MKNPTYNQSRNFSESYSRLSAKADSQTKNSKGHIMRKIYSITILAFCLFCLTSFAVKADDGLANTLIKCDSARVGDIKSAVERNLGHVSVILHENENTYLYCKLNQGRYERIALLECDYITEISQFSDVERASDMAHAQLYVDENVNYGSFEEITDLTDLPDNNDMHSSISLLEPDSLPFEWVCLDDSTGLPPEKDNLNNEYMSSQSWADLLGKRQIEDVLHGLIALIIFFPEGDEPHFQHTKTSIDSMKVHILAELDWMVGQANTNDIPLTFDVIFPSNQSTGAFRMGQTPAWGALGNNCDEPDEDGCVTDWIGELINTYGGYDQNYDGMVDLLNDRIHETGAGYSGVVFIPELAGNHCFRYDKLPVGGWSARWIHPCWDEDNFDVPWHGDCESDYNRYYGASYAVVLKGYYSVPKTAMITLHEILHWFGPTDMGNCDFWPYPSGVIHK